MVQDFDFNILNVYLNRKYNGFIFKVGLIIQLISLKRLMTTILSS